MVWTTAPPPTRATRSGSLLRARVIALVDRIHVEGPVGDHDAPSAVELPRSVDRRLHDLEVERVLDVVQRLAVAVAHPESDPVVPGNETQRRHADVGFPQAFGQRREGDPQVAPLTEGLWEAHKIGR